jgi:hypothetical protein
VSYVREGPELKDHMTYHAKSYCCPHLDEAMEVSKENGERKEQNISRVANEEADKLDDFGPEHEGKLSVKTIKLAVAG